VIAPAYGSNYRGRAGGQSDGYGTHQRTVARFVKWDQSKRSREQKHEGGDDDHCRWYSLTLDQSLITAMEDESRWMISGNMTNATAIPDFLHYVDVKGLDTVKPESVNIIGMARLP